MKMKKFIVAKTDISEGSDYRPVVMGAFDDFVSAKSFVATEMKEFCYRESGRSYDDVEQMCDFDNLRVVDFMGTNGHQYSITEMEMDVAISIGIN